MHEEHEVGERLAVTSKGGEALGLGTHVWDGEILLDTGRKIRAQDCTLAPAKGSFKPFDALLAEETRVFEREPGGLAFRDRWLKAGWKVGIEMLKVQPWNHGSYLAGRFTNHDSGTKYWVIISEVEFLEDGHVPRRSQPHARP